MIFLTLGTQLPFDRLVRAVDEWYMRSDKRHKIVAQIPCVEPSYYKPKSYSWSDWVPPDEYNNIFQYSDVVVSHAGMGTIITALRFRKPLIIMPRNKDMLEHRNNHQIATADKFSGRRGISIANSEYDVGDFLDRVDDLAAQKPDGIEEMAKAEFVNKIRSFIIDC